jgi:hypothetical protein
MDRSGRATSGVVSAAVTTSSGDSVRSIPTVEDEDERTVSGVGPTERGNLNWRKASISIGLAAVISLAVGVLAVWLLRDSGMSTVTLMFAVSIPAAAIAGVVAQFVESALSRRTH